MTTPEKKFALTIQDRSNPLWERLKAHLEKRLQTLRELNDRPTTEHETAKTRGQIAEIKALLQLDKPAPAELN